MHRGTDEASSSRILRISLIVTSGLGLGAPEKRGIRRWLTAAVLRGGVTGVGLGASRLRLYEATPELAVEMKFLNDDRCPDNLRNRETELQKETSFMARPRKEIKDPAKRKAHEAHLARRRERALEARKLKNAVAAAAEGAESEADFEKLVETERKRMKFAGGGQNQSPKTITAARENLTLAFDLMGGVPALVAWGRKNQTEFYRLWARLIPKESVEVTAQLPLEALLQKLSSRESMSVAEAAYSVGTEALADARVRVIEHDAQNPDYQNPYEDNDEETLQ